MSNSKRIKEKAHFYVSILAGAVQYTISKFGSEDTINKYVRNQGMEKEYKKLHYQ